MSYDPRKAAQTVAFFAIANGGSINVLKATKLVYLADREHIGMTGFPILSERRVSMPHGPANSLTLSHINGEYESAEWSAILRDRADHQVGLASSDLTADDLDELSDAEVESLSRVWHRFGEMDQWQIRDWTHEGNLPEWEDPNGSSSVIPLGRIMQFVGVPKEQADFVRECERLDTLLRSF